MALPPKQRADLEDRLSKIAPRIVDQPIQVANAVKNLLERFGVHASELRISIRERSAFETGAIDSDLQQMRERVELLKKLGPDCSWDNFVRACATKVDLQTQWRKIIAQTCNADPAYIAVRESMGYVPWKWFDHVMAMPDLDPHAYMPRSNYAEVCEPLESTLRSIGKTPHWIAKTLTDFISRFNGRQVTVADVRFPKPKKEK